jgi:predicted membrane protein
MNVGATLNSKAKPVTGHEVVLFRTRSEILTDQRIIIRGNIFPLSAISEIRVQMAWYYAPFLLVRLLLLPLAILLILSFLHVVGRDVVPGNSNLHLFGGVVLGLLLIVATWLVPMYTLKVKAKTGETETMMHHHDASYLREVKAKIEDAIRARQALDGLR